MAPSRCAQESSSALFDDIQVGYCPLAGCARHFVYTTSEGM
jgi:hypothetical protein